MRGAAAALVTLLLAGCGDEPEIRFAAPVQPRAAMLLEPPRLRLGEVATLEFAVVTGPGAELRHFEPPAAPDGLELVGIETPPPEDQGQRRVHRIRLRLRPLRTGSLTWPRSHVVVQEPDSPPRELRIGPRVIEVASVLPERPDRLAPFGVRGPPPGASRGSWASAALGAAATLALVGLVVLARRGHGRRRRTADEPPAVGPRPWTRARAELAGVRATAADDPFAAAHRLSTELRRYLGTRYAVDALARTSDELSRAEPPFAVRSHWPGLVALLADLDALRFRPEADTDARLALAARLAEALEAVEAFVEDGVPPEQRG